MKTFACELWATHELPLSRFSRTELHRLVVKRGVSEASASTIWRWLQDDALGARQWPLAARDLELFRALQPHAPTDREQCVGV